MSEDEKDDVHGAITGYLGVILVAFATSALKWFLLVGFTLFSLDRFFPTKDNYMWILLWFSIFGLWKALDYGEQWVDKYINRDSSN